jgi:hypothetical protein
VVARGRVACHYDGGSTLECDGEISDGYDRNERFPIHCHGGVGSSGAECWCRRRTSICQGKRERISPSTSHDFQLALTKYTDSIII